MGYNVNTGLTSITGNVTVQNVNGLPAPSATQTLIHISQTGGAGQIDAYTVTAGKTFYLMGGCAYHDCTVTVYKSDGTTIVLELASNSSGINAFIASAVPIITYAATTIIKCTATNGKKFTLWGYEA